MAITICPYRLPLGKIPYPSDVPMVSVQVVTNGRVTQVIPQFPQWILHRFSWKAKEDFAKLPKNVPPKVFRLEGPLAVEAVRCVLGWMEANQKAQGLPDHLLPDDLGLYKKMMVYHATNAIRVVPKADKLRANIYELIKTGPIMAIEFIFCCERLTFDKGLVTAIQRKVAELYIADALIEAEIQEIKQYTKTAGNKDLDIQMIGFVNDLLGYMRRNARRHSVHPGGIVHEEWHRKTPFEEPEKHHENDSVLVSGPEFTSGESAVPDTATCPDKATYAGKATTSANLATVPAQDQEAEATKTERRDLARLGLMALGEDDVRPLLQSRGVGFTIKPSKSQRSKKKRSYTVDSTDAKITMGEA
jgi:hypothetical protein